MYSGKYLAVFFQNTYIHFYGPQNKEEPGNA